MKTTLENLRQWQLDIGNKGFDAAMVVKHIGYCLEECAEALEVLGFVGDAKQLHEQADFFKSTVDHPVIIAKEKRKELVDAFADVVVFGLAGIMRCGYEPESALNIVAESNDSKRLADGSFMRNNSGKIIKPDSFKAPDWSKLEELRA